MRARGLKPLTDAAALLEQVVARDPDFAPAWALLAQAYELTPNASPVRISGSTDEFRRVADAFLTKAETAARRAILLDPRLADGYVALGAGASAAREASAGGRLSPRRSRWTPTTRMPCTSGQQAPLAIVGRFKEALAIRQRLQALEPFVPVFNWDTAQVLWLNGQNDAALTMFQALPPDSPCSISCPLYATAGRYGEAADALLQDSSGGAPRNGRNSCAPAAHRAGTGGIAADASHGWAF